MPIKQNKEAEIAEVKWLLACLSAYYAELVATPTNDVLSLMFPPPPTRRPARPERKHRDRRASR